MPYCGCPLLDLVATTWKQSKWFFSLPSPVFPPFGMFMFPTEDLTDITVPFLSS